MRVDCQWPTPIKRYLDGASHVHTRARNIAFVKDPIVCVKEFSDADHMFRTRKGKKKSTKRQVPEGAERKRERGFSFLLSLFSSDHFTPRYFLINIDLILLKSIVFLIMTLESFQSFQPSNQSRLVCYSNDLLLQLGWKLSHVVFL